MKYLFKLFFFILLCSCGSSSSAPENPPMGPVAEVKAEKEILDEINLAPESFIGTIQANANGIEATMYSSGASFSVFDKSSVYAFTSLIAAEAPKSLTKNQIGHIMFLQDGENILLATVFNNGTDVYMQAEDKESGEKYYNVLTGKARDLFTNVQVEAK